MKKYLLALIPLLAPAAFALSDPPPPPPAPATVTIPTIPIDFAQLATDATTAVGGLLGNVTGLIIVIALALIGIVWTVSAIKARNPR